MSDNFVKIFGARGSVPVNGIDFVKFGGATTCILVNLSGNTIVVDAGSGLCRIPRNISINFKLDILLTHMHLDHLIGLPLCPFVLDSDNHLNIHIPECWGNKAEKSIRQLFSLPYWPVTLDDLPAEIHFHQIKENDYINNIRVETMLGVHPGGIAVYKISNSEKSVVIATDCTLTNSLFHKLEEFADHCDLLLIDGQYSDQEWMRKSAYGHSKWSDSAALGIKCGAKKVRMIHHDPQHKDKILIRAEKELKDIAANCAFAREDEVIFL